MSGYVGNVPVPQSTQTRDNFTATSGQTTFSTSGYTPNYLDVYLNGVHLDPSDYTATNGTDVVLDVGATAGDTVTVLAFKTFEVSADINNSAVTTGVFTSNGIDDNATSTAMTLDASGNLLVGTTSTAIYGSASSASAGDVVIGNSTYAAIQANNDGQQVAILNRTGTDGGITQFRKDGTTVGSIGVDNIDNIYLSGNAGHSGLMCGTDGILPYANGTVTDNSEDLGQGSYRWKDLYLSGGVYLGGASAANHLDDYEEGSWTPTNTGGTLTIVNARYTKVGRMVTVACHVVAQTSTSGDWGGLPFAAGNGGMYSGSSGYQNQQTTESWNVMLDTGTLWTFRKGTGSMQLSAGNNARMVLTYFTA